MLVLEVLRGGQNFENQQEEDIDPPWRRRGRRVLSFAAKTEKNGVPRQHPIRFRTGFGAHLCLSLFKSLYT